jgi:RND superfamily putative drug exporter
MPSIKVLPAGSSARVGYDVVKERFGPGAPGMLQVVAGADQAAPTISALQHDPGIAHVLPAQPAADDSGLVLVSAMPTVDPSDPELGATVDRLREGLPSSAQVGGAAVENLDLKAQLDNSTPLVIAVVLLLGFVLLLVALQAPLIAFLGTLVSLLSTAASFGVARLVFQEGWGAGLLGFESQGFLDGWAPVFFFAMIFAIAMDYTVFLLASAKEHYERSGDPREAMVGAVAHSGRVIFAAGAVMVAVFFTFALSGPLPPKEMGIVLGVAVLLDAFLVRLVLLPVLLRLTGRAAWWVPGWLRRVLPDIHFSHG